MNRSFILLAVLAAALLRSPGAGAFCRTTTCNPNEPAENCQLDSKRCVITGKHLAWRSSCVTVGVHRLGSASSRLGYDEIAPVVQQAFSAWTNADCDGAPPSIEVQSIGAVECGVSEYNSEASNANIVLFRDDDWPYVGAGNAIAVTTTRFDKELGDLWDADIELNAHRNTFSVGDPVSALDLRSVLTHEAGHFLGLSHTLDGNATMKLSYDPQIDGVELRSLGDDDIAGICAVYPPGRAPVTTSCANRHGFSEQCGADQPHESRGCSVGAPMAPSRALGELGLFALTAALVRSRLAKRRRVV